MTLTSPLSWRQRDHYAPRNNAASITGTTRLAVCELESSFFVAASTVRYSSACLILPGKPDADTGSLVAYYRLHNAHRSIQLTEVVTVTVGADVASL